MLSDLRFAVRSLGKAKGFTAVAVTTLALGIGLNTAMFSVVNAVLLRPLPYEGADRLVHLWEQSGEGAMDAGQVSLRNLAEWRERARSFEAIGAYRYWIFNLSGSGPAEALLGAYVSPDLFPILRARPALGRTFAAGEDAPSAAPVALISDELWRRRYGADRGVVGRSVVVNGRPHTIVGVMPAAFEFPGTIPATAVLPSRTLDVWTPLTENPLEAGRGQHNWWALGRLRPGVPVAEAAAEMRALGADQHARFPEADADVRVMGLRERVVAPVRPALILMLAAVGLVLLIACANVANLLLARGGARTRELAVRAALGAGRRRIVRQLLAECLVLAAAGGALGALLALWAVDGAVRLAPASLPRVAGSQLDLAVLGFAAAATLATALVFGLYPALHAARESLAETLRAGGRGTSTGRGARRSRAALVVGEVALSLVLLASAGLLVRSYQKLQRVTLGFEPGRVLTMLTLLPAEKYPDARRQSEFYRRAVERLAALPGASAAATVNVLPLSGLGSSNSVFVAGRPAPPPGQRPEADYRVVSPDYFRTLGIARVSGRGLTAADTAGAPRVTVVSETLARRLFPGESPLGQRLAIGGDAPAEIVGVVADVKDDGLDAPAQMTTYVAVAQQPEPIAAFAVRTAGDPLALAGAARAAVASIDPDQPVMNVRAYDSYLAASVETRRFTLLLLAAFAAAAFALAAVGLYGVVAYVAGLRTHEIGVRIAIGAQRRDVVRLVVGGGLRLAGAGLLAGVAGALAVTRLLAAHLYGVQPADPLTFAAVALALGIGALAASWLPARRAARVDPVTVLRNE